MRFCTAYLFQGLAGSGSVGSQPRFGLEMSSHGADGFGTDELRYADTGRYLDTLNIQWDAYDDTVYIDYGRVDLPRELRRVHIRRGMQTTDLYIGGRYYDRITLYMR